MSSVALRNQYGDLFGPDSLPVLEEIVQTNYDMHPSRRELLFKIVPHDREIWQSTEMHDLPLFKVVPEATEYSYERAMQGANKTLTVVKYGSGFSVSREMVEDGKFPFIADMSEKLGRSAKETQEIAAMNVINNGFTTELTADGVSLFNSAHPMPRGGTFRNTLTVASDLSESSLKQMLTDFETQFVTDNGIILNIKPKILWVHPDNRRYAQELVGSDLRPDSAENNINTLKSDGLIVMSSPHFTDPDAWGLSADSSQTGLFIIARRGFQVERAGSDLGFHTDSQYIKASYREAIGAVHGRGIFATAGA